MGMARWGLSVCSHFTFARAHPAGTLRESCMRENCTCSLSGGRRPACSSDRAPPPTRLRIAGCWLYLFRAVDSSGQTVDFYLSETRGREAAKIFLKRAMANPNNRPVHVLTRDGLRSYPAAPRE